MELNDKEHIKTSYLFLMNKEFHSQTDYKCKSLEFLCTRFSEARASGDQNLMNCGMA